MSQKGNPFVQSEQSLKSKHSRNGDRASDTMRSFQVAVSLDKNHDGQHSFNLCQLHYRIEQTTGQVTTRLCLVPYLSGLSPRSPLFLSVLSFSCSSRCPLGESPRWEIVLIRRWTQKQKAGPPRRRESSQSRGIGIFSSFDISRRCSASSSRDHV